MRKRLLLIAIVAVLLLAVALPVMAVQFGEPDTDPVMYPSVGLLVTYPGSGPYVYLCTVALIDANSVLTAGHCTEGALVDDPATWFPETAVGFDQSYTGISSDFWLESDTIVGVAYTHPDYNFPSYDVGVVNLDSAPAGLTPYALAAPGTLDGLQGKKPILQVAGYGMQDALPPVFQSDLARYRGEVKLNNLNSNINGTFGSIQFSANPGAAHKGGTCFGDSGGPDLLNGEIVAVNSFVMNGQCMGNGWGFRVDNAAIQEWITSIAALND